MGRKARMKKEGKNRTGNEAKKASLSIEDKLEMNMELVSMVEDRIISMCKEDSLSSVEAHNLIVSLLILDDAEVEHERKEEIIRNRASSQKKVRHEQLECIKGELQRLGVLIMLGSRLFGSFLENAEIEHMLKNAVPVDGRVH